MSSFADGFIELCNRQARALAAYRSEMTVETWEAMRAADEAVQEAIEAARPLEAGA